jgi:ribonuclease VapC
VNEPVLDASALLAYLNAEPGADAVEEALGTGARVGVVNWAEVLSKVAERGGDPAALEDRLERAGILGQALEVISLTREDALTVGKLRPLTTEAGLSLADRSCLALAIRLAVPALSTDRDWGELDAEALGIEVRLIR